MSNSENKNRLRSRSNTEIDSTGDPETDFDSSNIISKEHTKSNIRLLQSDIIDKPNRSKSDSSENVQPKKCKIADQTEPCGIVCDDALTASTQEASQGNYTLRHRLDPEPKVSISRLDSEEEFVKIPTQVKTQRDRLKVREIQSAVDSGDLETLRKLAISPGGLVNKAMRQIAWPLLVGANMKNITPKPSHETILADQHKKTYDQVCLDVQRSSSRFPPGIDDHVRMSVKDKLVDLIMRLMIKHPQLNYYQGYHDVCITFLLCMDEDSAFAVVEKLSLAYMREYLDGTMERTQILLNYILPVIKRCNNRLFEHMQECCLGTVFALPWVITWFSHVLGDIRRILRVFDFFIASHRMMPIYVSAAIVLHFEKELFEAEDMGYMHKTLTVLPTDLPIEDLLERAGDLYLQYPPLEVSREPLLAQLNREVYAQFERVSARSSRRQARQSSDLVTRMFVKLTMFTVTALVGVAAAVVYHTYHNEFSSVLNRTWNPFS